MANYQDAVFTGTYPHNNDTLYATFHPELILKDDKYDTTGRYFVVLLHPNKGLESFYINFDDNNNKWALNENTGEIVEDELVKWCGDQIDAHRK